MPSRYRHLRLVRPTPAEVEQWAATEAGARLGLDEQFGYVAPRQPVGVGTHDLGDVRRLALQRELSWPGERRTAPLARLAERTPVLFQFDGGKRAENATWQDHLDEEVLVDDQLLP